MKQGNGLEFVNRFQVRPYQPALDEKRHDKQGIVARHAQQPLAGNQQHGREEESDKETGPRFLEAEQQEFGDESSRPGEVAAGVASINQSSSA